MAAAVCGGVARSRFTAGVCRAFLMATAVCGGRSPGQIYRKGMPGFFDGNGGMRVAGAWHNKTVTNGG